MEETIHPNEGKQLVREVDGVLYERLPIRTHVITKDDTIEAVVQKYAVSHLKNDDILFISERVIAITQGRSIPIADIHPSWLANFLVRFVHKSPYGIGLGSPWTMELALREVGSIRILFGACIAAITKPFGIKGVFYRICGRKIAAIDGPCDYTLPPYNRCATLAPLDPTGVARRLKETIGHEVVIIDANDLGVDVLGVSSEKTQKKFIKEVFRDNPLGQSTEQTPLCVVRRV